MAATDATKFLNKTEYERTLARLRQYCDQKESSVTEEASFLYRKSPDVGNRDYFVAKSVKGKTLVWNQRIVNGNLSNGTNGWSASGRSTILASNGVLTVTITATPTSNYTGYVAKPFSKTSGHKYYFHVEVNVPHDGRFILDTNSEIQTQLYDVSANNWEKLSSIASAVRDGLSGSLYPRELSDGYVSGDSFKIRNYYVIDLTLMFGSGNEPATVEEFESMFPLTYYDYNPGELISFNAEGIQTVGFNQWDEEIELGYVNPDTGEEVQATNRWRSKNYIPVLPSTAYYLCNILASESNVLYVVEYDGDKQYNYGANTYYNNRVYTTKPGTRYLRIFNYRGTTYENNICINFSDPAKNGTYEPYKKSTLTLDVASMTSGGVQIFPDGMRSAGSVYDEAIVDTDGYVRKVVKRIGDVDLGTLTWSYRIPPGRTKYHFMATTGAPSDLRYRFPFVGLCAKYTMSTAQYGEDDKTINYVGYTSLPEINVVDSDYTSAEDFKAAMSGVMLYYELATPVEYTLDEPIFVGSGFNGGGIQKVIQENTSAPHTTPFSGSFEYGRMPAMDVISLVNESSNMITSHYLPLTGGTLTGNLTAPSFIKIGGTSSQFLKADGSVDSNAYLPLTGGTMSGAIKFPTGNREILHFAGTDGSWGSGLKYSWSNRTAIAFWGKHAETAFVWNAGTDYSATDVPSSGTSYDFKIQRVSGVPNVTTTGKYIGTAFVKKDGTSSQFLKADGSVDSNTYATTAQLTNGSVTKLGTATVGSSTMPIFLNAGTPTAITSFPEAYLSWGGKNFSAAYGPIDAAMVGNLGACRTMFAKAAGIEIEYSRDAGETWVDYEATDAQKVALFSDGGAAFVIGKNSTAGDGGANYMLRVNLYTSNAGIYTSLNKIVVYVSTNGSTGCYCTIRARYQSTYESDVDSWRVFADQIPISGWSGYNVINISGLTTYGNVKTSQYGHIQFIFGCTGANSGNYGGLNVSKIFCFGGVGWTIPSNMAKNGHLYSWDVDQNAIFPNGIRPSISGKDLGTASNRWNIFGTELNLSGAASVGTTLSVTGNTTLGGTLSVGSSSANKATTLYGTLTATGAITAYSTLTVSGATTLNGGAAIKGVGNAVTNINGGSATVDYSHIFVTGGSNNTRPLVLQNGYGNVGVGITVPSYKLDVNGTTRVSGISTLAGGIVLGTSTNAVAAKMEWDETNNAWKLNGNFYATGFISAGGVSQSGGSGAPIEINTEDFAEVDGVLQLADRTTSNGMGYIILRKDMSFASQITKTNTIYEVRYSFNLSGASVTIPSNCVLKFVGGMLVNGTVTGTNTKIDAPFVRIFSDNISLAGTWALDEFPVSWYGGEVNDSSVDISAVISKILEQFVTIFPGRNASGGHPYGGAKITLLEGAYYAKTPIVIYDYSPTSNGEGLNPMDGTSACEIEGSSKYGTYIHNSNTGDNFFLTNLRDGTHRHHWGLTLRFLTFIGGNGIKMVRPWDFHIEHCTFYNGGTAIKFFATVNTHINDCSFYNTVTAIEFDSSMGGGGVSTTFTIENCWIAWCRIGFKLSSIRTGDGFEFIIRNTIFEYCRASLQVQSISERNTLLIDECYFEGNPPDITTYGNTSTIEGVDCYFRHCLTDPIDYGFVKNGTCRFYWEGYMKPKLTLGDTTASKNVTIVVDGKTLYNNYDNHIVKTTGFFDNTPGVLYASEIGEAGAVRVNVRSGDDMNEGLWEWDGQGYSLSKEIAQTKAITYENSSFVFSKTSTDATFEAWLSGDKNTALVGPWIAKLQAKFSGFSGRETPLKKLLATLGAGNNSALWQKIKHLHFPVLALPSDGANVGYDLITDTVRTLNSYTIYENRGVYPTAGGGNTGALSVSGVSAANISFFGIVTYRADTLSIGSSAAECFYDQGYRINFNKQSMGFINASAEFGNFAYSDLNTEVPIAFAMSANTGSARTICKDSTSKSVSETAYGAGDSYQLSGQRSYAATSVFAICDGLTPAEALTASTALATFAIEFGILGNSNQ